MTIVPLVGWVKSPTVAPSVYPAGALTAEVTVIGMPVMVVPMVLQ